MENQVRGLDVGPPQMAHQGVQYPLFQPQIQSQWAPQTVPYTAGTPSVLSALDEMGVRGVERRIITLPPIIQPATSSSSHRGPGGGGVGTARGGPRLSSQSSGSENRSGGGLPLNSRGYRDVPLPSRGILRDYSDDSDWDSRQGRTPNRGSRNRREVSSGRRGGSRPRTRSRDDLMEELHSRASRRERSYSPPLRHKGSWSSDEEDSRRRKGGKGKDWAEKPPSYFSIANQPEHSNGRRNYNHLSVRSTHQY